MKVLTHYYPDRWSHIERRYKNSCRLEVHLIEFCKKMLAGMGDKNLDRVKAIIENEVVAFKKHITNRGDVEIIKHKAGTVRGPDGGKVHYAISIIFPNKAPSFEISEPIP